MHRWIGRVAMVTGAANGVGAATVKLLVENGMKVAAVNCATDFEKCEALATNLNKGKSDRYLLPVECDISKEDQVLQMFKKIKSEFGRLDVCVNSAGVGRPKGNLIEGSTESWNQILDVNILGLSLCTREAIKLMQERGDEDGHVIHIGSYSGHRIPGMHVMHMYSGSKHAVRALTEGLRRELRALNSNIRISSISPGAIDTQFGKGAIPDLGTRADPSKCPSKGIPYPSKPQQQATGPHTPVRALTAEDVAYQVLHCLQQPQHVQIQDIVILPTYQPG